MDKIKDRIQMYPPTDELIETYSTDKEVGYPFQELLVQFLDDELGLCLPGNFMKGNVLDQALPAVGWPEQVPPASGWLGKRIRLLLLLRSNTSNPERLKRLARELMDFYFVEQFNDQVEFDGQESTGQNDFQRYVAELCVMGKPDQDIFLRRFTLLRFLVDFAITSCHDRELERESRHPREVIDELTRREQTLIR